VLLAIDVGNTQTVIGLYGEGDRSHELVDHWRVATKSERTSDEHALLIQEFLSFAGHDWRRSVSGVAISSGVPTVTYELRRMCDRYLGMEPVVLGTGVKTGMPVLYDNPKEVGADRIANAVGAFDLYGGPTIVVDFGTATTFDVISAKGEYPGAPSSPGSRSASTRCSAARPRCARSSSSSPGRSSARPRSSRCSPARSTGTRRWSTGCATASRSSSASPR
jgi:type III pantothenate kinase